MGLGGSIPWPASMKSLYGMLDQFLTSGTTFLVAVWFAQGATAEEFGWFAIAQVGFITLVGVSRVTIGQSVTVRAVSASGRESSDGLVLALSLGIMGMLLAAFAALALGQHGGGLGDNLLWFGLCAPAVLLIDAARSWFHATGVGHRALYTSLTVFMLTIGVWQLTADLTDFPQQALVGYFFATLAGALIVLARAPRLSTVASAALMARHELGVWKHTIGGFASNSVAIIAVPILVAATAGTPATAGLRAAQAVMGFPLQVPQGLQALSLAQGLRERNQQYSAERRLRGWVLLNLLLFSVLAPVTVFIPMEWGVRLFGNTWAYASSALPIVALGSGAAACTVGIEVYARIRNRTHEMAAVRALMVIPVLAAATLGSVIAGVVGAAVGLCAGQFLLFGAAMVCVRVGRTP